MDASRRRFVSLFTSVLSAMTALPVAAAVAPGKADDTVAASLWSALSRIKNGPDAEADELISRLQGQKVRVSGYVGRLPGSGEHGHVNFISFQSPACCAECLLYGGTPVILTKHFSPSEQPVVVEGRLHIECEGHVFQHFSLI